MTSVSDEPSDSIPTSVSDDDETSISSSTTTTTTSTGPKKKFSVNVVPWESGGGTRRLASQKGMGAFGCARNVVMKVANHPPPLSRTNSESVIPKLTGGSESFPKGDKFVPFGDMRDVVRRMEQPPKDKEKKRAIRMHTKPGLTKADTFLSLWNTPNPNAKNTDIGKSRGTTMEVVGAGNRDRRCDTILPRLQQTAALPGTGAIFQNRRQVTTKVEGFDLSSEDEAKSKAILPWATGRVAIETQSGTGGFLKPRDVCNQTYYDEKKPLPWHNFSTSSS